MASCGEAHVAVTRDLPPDHLGSPTPREAPAEARPLRVCLVSADYPTTSVGGIGGIGAHTSALAHALSGLGHDVTVLTESESGRGRHSDGPIAVNAIPQGSGRQWKLGSVLPVQWLQRSRAVARELTQLQMTRKFDLVSFPDGYGEGFYYSFAPRGPFVVYLFGPASLVQQWDGREISPLRRRSESWLERRPAARADIVISATRRFADVIGPLWSIDPRRVRIIRNPLDLSRFRPPADGSGPAADRVLFVGHLQPLKGLHALAEAIPIVASRHPKAEFWFVGNDTRSAPGSTSMRQLLEARFSDAGIRDRVRFFDPVPQAELVGFYQHCAVFTLPSLNDVYPNAVLEALACGRPCVVTDTVGAAELVAEGDAGRIVPPGTAAHLAEALSSLLALTHEGRAAMGARGRAVVERHCAMPVIARQTIEAFRDAIDRGRPAGNEAALGRT